MTTPLHNIREKKGRKLYRKTLKKVLKKCNRDPKVDGFWWGLGVGKNSVILKELATGSLTML